MECSTRRARRDRRSVSESCVPPSAGCPGIAYVTILHKDARTGSTTSVDQPLTGRRFDDLSRQRGRHAAAIAAIFDDHRKGDPLAGATAIRSESDEPGMRRLGAELGRPGLPGHRYVKAFQYF